jgi:hypothetical protein
MDARAISPSENPVATSWDGTTFLFEFASSDQNVRLDFDALNLYCNSEHPREQAAPGCQSK